MKTKLEVGKEYWLDKEENIKVKLMSYKKESLFFEPVKEEYKFKQINCLTSIEYVSESIPSELHDTETSNLFKFTTPIAMKCTEDQFNVVKDKLAEMGYSADNVEFYDSGVYLCSQFAGDNNYVTTIFKVVKQIYNPIVLESFNPDLFLALAAMTDKEDGIKGEWWKGNDSGKLFKQTIEKNLNTSGVIRKATAQEIIEHFEKKEFMLQPRWYVELTHENYSIVKKWHENIDNSSSREYTIGAYYGVYESGKGDAWTYSKDAKKYQIITTDQFKKYVLKETAPSCQVIPIPPTKQATLFDDRVEITDWEPKDGEAMWRVLFSFGEPIYQKAIFNSSNDQHKSKLIKRTESEAKQLVEKLKQAML